MPDNWWESAPEDKWWEEGVEDKPNPLVGMREQIVAPAIEGALRRSREAEQGAAPEQPPLEPTGSVWADSALAGMGHPSATNLEDAGSNLATAATIMSLPATKAAAIRAGWGVVGGLGGAGIGKGVGSLVESIGAPSGTSRVLGTIGGLAGGLVGGVGKKAGLEKASEFFGTLKGSFNRGAGQRVASAEAKEALALAARRVALAEQKFAEKVRREALKDAMKAAPKGASVENARKAADVAKVLGKGQRAMPTNLGGAARPGPPPTPPDELEAALRASIEANAAKAGRATVPKNLGRDVILHDGRRGKIVGSLGGGPTDRGVGAGASSSPPSYKVLTESGEEVMVNARGLKMALPSASSQSTLRDPRLAIGAEKVGRSAGLSKEEIRKQTGTVLDEALGEASPVMPKQALKSIIDTMRKIPIEQREAYVAQATSGKNKWQVENIRRTLEHLGLLIPAGVAGSMANE